MSKNKVLTISELKKMDAKNYGEKKTIISQGFEIVIEKHFKPSKIQELFAEMLEKQRYADEQKINFNIMDAFMIFIIKKFTSIGDSMKDSTLRDDLLVLEMLVNNNILQDIIEVFENDCADEMQKIVKQLDDMKNNIEKLAENEIAKVNELKENSEVESTEELNKEDESHHLKMDKESKTISWTE